MGVDSKYVEFNIAELDIYRKKNLLVHYIESLAVASQGRKIVIPTLEGDVIVSASANQYIMIGPCNDLYPISKDLFASKYTEAGLCEDSEIAEFVHSLGWNTDKIYRCKLHKPSYVYAKKVPFDFKVYLKQCDFVIYGKAGDFYAIAYEDIENKYIIQADVLEKTYDKVDLKSNFLEEVVL